MSLTADVKSAWLGPTSGRSADTPYSLSTGPCWFRGAHIAVDTGTTEVEDVLLSFHDSDSTDAENTFLTVGVGSKYSCSFLVSADECFMDATNDGIWVSCDATASSDAELALNGIMLTVFYS